MSGTMLAKLAMLKQRADPHLCRGNNRCRGATEVGGQLFAIATEMAMRPWEVIAQVQPTGKDYGDLVLTFGDELTCSDLGDRMQTVLGQKKGRAVVKFSLLEQLATRSSVHSETPRAPKKVDLSYHTSWVDFLNAAYDRLMSDPRTGIDPRRGGETAAWRTVTNDGNEMTVGMSPRLLDLRRLTFPVNPLVTGTPSFQSQFDLSVAKLPSSIPDGRSPTLSAARKAQVHCLLNKVVGEVPAGALSVLKRLGVQNDYELALFTVLLHLSTNADRRTLGNEDVLGDSGRLFADLLQKPIASERWGLLRNATGVSVMDLRHFDLEAVLRDDPQFGSVLRALTALLHRPSPPPRAQTMASISAPEEDYNDSIDSALDAGYGSAPNTNFGRAPANCDYGRGSESDTDWEYFGVNNDADLLESSTLSSLSITTLSSVSSDNGEHPSSPKPQVQEPKLGETYLNKLRDVVRRERPSAAAMADGSLSRQKDQSLSSRDVSTMGYFEGRRQRAYIVKRNSLRLTGQSSQRELRSGEWLTFADDAQSRAASDEWLLSLMKEGRQEAMKSTNFKELYQLLFPAGTHQSTIDLNKALIARPCETKTVLYHFE